jgi:hypothetical protein
MIPLDYILYIQIYLLVWFWCSFEPITDLIDYLWDKLPSNITRYKVVDYLYIGIGCTRCLCLYVTLLLTGNIFIAIFLAMLADIQKKITK